MEISVNHSEKLQSTLQKAFESQHPNDFEHAQAKAITKYIDEMICVVEDDVFCRLIRHLAPLYKIPSGMHFSNVVIPEIFYRISNSIRSLLTQSTLISLTINIWTSDNMIRISE